jgi:hypothetical protein
VRTQQAAAEAAQAVGQAFERQVVGTAISWVEWMGMRILEPYLAERSSSDLAKCLRGLVALLRQVKMQAEVSIHVRTFATALAGEDPALADTLTLDLQDMLLEANRITPSPIPAPSPPANVVPPSYKPPLLPSTGRNEAPARLGVFELSKYGVEIDDLYVWSNSPMRLHWTKGSPCDNKLLKLRAPSIEELSLPLCPICSDLQRNEEQSTAPYAKGDPSLKLGSMTPPRDKAEIILIHTLLRDESLRAGAQELCREAGLLGSDAGNAQPSDASALLLTPIRRL